LPQKSSPENPGSGVFIEGTKKKRSLIPAMNLSEHPPQKILIINTFGIGDVLFTNPVVVNLKLQFPNAYIGYLGNRRTSAMLEADPNIDKVFIYERDEFNVVYKKSKICFLRKIHGLLNEIRREKFDLVLDFSLNTSMNYMTWFIGIPRRVGFNYKNRSPLLTQKFSLQGFETKHVAEYYLELLKELGVSIHKHEMEYYISVEDKLWADDFFRRHGLKDDAKPIGVFPGAGVSWGAGARYRRWAPEKYAKLLDKLIEKVPGEIILFGDKSETDLCTELRFNRSQIIQAFGQTSLGQLAALMKKCRLVILNDGGPLHIAVGVKVKTVSVFGPVDEKVYGPYGNSQDHLVVTRNILCRPCYRQFRMTQCEHVSCLKQITVEDVFEKVQEILYQR
jgi:heptosyltransferase-2